MTGPNPEARPPDPAAPLAPAAGDAPPGPVSALAPVAAALAARFPGAILETIEYRGETTLVVAPEQVVELCRFLRAEPGLEFIFLVDLCAIHWMDRAYSYEVVYLLHSFLLNARIRLKARLGEDGRIATLTGVHPGADWHEREAFDLVGVVFEGHPDLRRILMPDDYDANPLRKDFPMKGY
jgi:NADH-quinone oxidoreductase subunit C